MFSATICEDDIRLLRRRLTSYKPSVRNLCNKAIEIFDKYHDYLTEKTLMVNDIMDDALNAALKNIKETIEFNFFFIYFDIL